ncbi:MAG: DEAD/DEAH box helicase [Armatimonadota bacterium]|nr:DEAD/DEAH box helicase [Armatimonadota bacterium]
MSETLTKNRAGFAGLGLSPRQLDVVRNLGFTTPTPIQKQAVPVAMKGNDVMGIAQTGTGKTLAFGLPIVERISDTRKSALILVPTRELALQVEATLRKIATGTQLRTVVLIGGMPMEKQSRNLRANPQIIIATPGRLMDHMQRRSVRMDSINVVVLDEADRMLDMGFLPNIKTIMLQVPEKRQMMLFSATMPKEIAEISKRWMRDPVRIDIDHAGSTPRLISQELVVVEKDQKGGILARLLQDHDGPILVFSRTRHGARKVAKILRNQGHAAAEIHSDRTMSQRRTALEGFKSGTFRVLVATDIAARGIDVKQISLVINYDLPATPDDYFHRIGRTGRAGQTGKAVTLATPDQSADVRAIQKAMKEPLVRSHRYA